MKHQVISVCGGHLLKHRLICECDIALMHNFPSPVLLFSPQFESTFECSRHSLGCTAKNNGKLDTMESYKMVPEMLRKP